MLHVIHAAENKKSVFIEDEGRHKPSFLAFILVIKNFHVNGPDLVLLSFPVSAT